MSSGERPHQTFTIYQRNSDLLYQELLLGVVQFARNVNRTQTSPEVHQTCILYREADRVLERLSLSFGYLLQEFLLVESTSVDLMHLQMLICNIESPLLVFELLNVLMYSVVIDIDPKSCLK